MAAVPSTREEFLKSQYAAVAKALNTQEAPLKEKHARTLIMGSHKERGGGMFWNCVTKIQLEANPFLSWKFLHLLHKLIRDGHPHFLSDSLKFRSKIQDLGKLWGHLKTGYGPLIQQYCRLLVVKLQFHSRNPQIPGSLSLTDAQLNAVGETDVNEWFDLAIQMLDFLDEVLTLQYRVFESMEMSRASSMSRAGQCRLAPLILCILDSNSLYDYVVKMIFKLHSSLPPDFLAGHRNRFNEQFPKLSKFYSTCRNLQYFRLLISIPTLPNEPPDFLKASAFDDYVTPQARLLQEGGGDASPPDSVSLAEDAGMLVDLTPAPSLVQEAAPPPPPSPRVDDRDRQIAALHHQLEDAKGHIQMLHSSARGEVEDSRRKVLELEHQLNSLRLTYDQVLEDCERYRQQAETLQNERNQQQLNEQFQQNYKVMEERFNKMKDAYVKLRQEHITVLSSIKGTELTRDSLQADKGRLEKELASLQETLQALRTASAATLSQSLVDQLAAVADACARVTMDVTDQLEGPAFAAATCPAEYCLGRLTTTFTELASLETSLASSSSANQPKTDLLAELAGFTAVFGELVLCSRATANGVGSSRGGQQNAEAVSGVCASSSAIYSRFLTGVRSVPGWSGAKTALEQLRANLDELKACLDACMGTSDQGDIDAEELGRMIEREMKRMDGAIQDAMNKIQSMLTERKAQDTGIKLEVNESILDACSSLMNAILQLVRRARDLQAEIVVQGRGSGSVNEFYKKHHQWTEGLLSAAKSVGSGAETLLEIADKVVRGEGKFETLIVASQEIAASSAQLVMASKVKADPASDRLHSLQGASRTVASATASVVTTTKSGMTSLQEQDLYNFAQDVTVHQAKKLEMESKVKLLELEAAVQKERGRLAELRKRHYELAGPAAGWEDGVDGYGH